MLVCHPHGGDGGQEVSETLAGLVLGTGVQGVHSLIPLHKSQLTLGVEKSDFHVNPNATDYAFHSSHLVK